MLTRTEGSPPVEILLVEDNAGDAQLMRIAFGDADPETAIVEVP